MIHKPVLVLKKYWVFILLGFITISIFFGGPQISVFLIRDGKPIRKNIDIPVQADQIKYSIDNLTQYDKQGFLYEINGWAFLSEDLRNSSDSYITEIVLISGNINYVFSTQPKDRMDVINAFKDLHLNIQKPGFTMVFNKNLLKTGIYTIGIFLKQSDTGSVKYIATNMVINRTPNTIELSSKSAP